jgi:hypothetical protein
MNDNITVVATTTLVACEPEAVVFIAIRLARDASFCPT